MIAAYIFITTSESTNVIFTALILGGISTGALISLAAHLPAYYALLFPTMFSGIVLYIHVGTSISYYTAALGAILMIFLFVSAKRLNATLVANVAMKFEYKYLFSDLAEAKMKTDQLNENLKTEINERRIAEEKSHHAMHLAETANKAKTEFLSSMSHELRTPLNAIMGYGQLLELSSKNQKDIKFINEILRGGRHLLALINQVLDLSKIERGQMEITAASARAEDIIKDALAMVEPQAQSQGIKLDFHLPKTNLPRLFVDQTRVLQVLLNILSNAIKFNTSAGQVTVSAKEIAEQTDGRFVRITVADTGKGIPTEAHHEVFEPFNRLTHQNSHIEGTGIGLSICKLLVELMDGKIDFQSNENEGSVFWIDLPIDITDETRVTNSPSTAMA
jgi:signal transduction histidine kinase